MQHKRVSVGELLWDYVSAAENVTEWGRSKKADIARLQAPCLADIQATKLTEQDLRQVLDRAKAELLCTRVIANPAQRARRLLPEEEAKLLEHLSSRDGRAAIPIRTAPMRCAHASVGC